MDAIDTLTGIANALQRPVELEKIGKMTVEMIRGHLYEGNGFCPLAPATVDYRKTGRPLQDTGALRDSITYSFIDGRTVSVGTNKPYAALQNSGGVIRAQKNWLWIPGPGVRKIERSKKGHGWGPTNVLKTLKSQGNSIFRMGRTIRYWPKGKKPPKDPWDYPVAYYLKKSVEIPARKFFYLTGAEIDMIAKEVGVDLNQL